MIDKIINSALDTASPLITKWRTFFFILTVIFFSPKIEDLLKADLLTLGIKNFFSLTLNLISSTSFFLSIFIAIILYILIPLTNSLMIKSLVSLLLPRAKPLTDEIDSLKSSEPKEIEKIIEANFDEKKEKYNEAYSYIYKSKERAEITLLSTAMYLFSSLKINTFNEVALSGFLFIYLAICFYISHNILIKYLSYIATFNILLDHIRKPK